MRIQKLLQLLLRCLHGTGILFVFLTACRQIGNFYIGAVVGPEPQVPFRIVPTWFHQSRLHEKTTSLPQIHLLVAHYMAPTEVRKAELYYCFQRQLANPAIDHIHVFYETEDAKQLMYKIHPKVTPHVIDQRVTFLHAIKFANRYLQKKIVVFANGDIYFDGTLDLARFVNWRPERGKQAIFSISRYEDHGLGRFTSPKVSRYFGSHDTFIWYSPIVRSSRTLYRHLDYPIGKAGSENRFMYIMSRIAKHYVYNPALSITTWHVHNSNERTYDVKDRVDMRHGRGVKVPPISLNNTMFLK